LVLEYMWLCVAALHQVADFWKSQSPLWGQLYPPHLDDPEVALMCVNV
jgi:hypothetical protein